LANIKSAKKRIKVIEKKTLRNKMVKSRAKTAIKKAINAISVGTDSVDAVFRSAISEIDKAVSKGVYHRNTAARKKSRLAKLLNNKPA
jgi:small subunit ribosomal protein S20